MGVRSPGIVRTFPSPDETRCLSGEVASTLPPSTVLGSWFTHVSFLPRFHAGRGLMTRQLPQELAAQVATGPAAEARPGP